MAVPTRSGVVTGSSLVDATEEALRAQLAPGKRRTLSPISWIETVSKELVSAS